MDYRQPVQAACKELADELSGMEAEFDGEVDLKLTDPALILDFQRLEPRPVREHEKPPNPYEVSITLHNEEQSSYFPWLSGFRDYLEANKETLQSESVVSFVESTGNDNTDRNYLRQRRETLEDQGIDREDQILLLLPNHIPESLTQLLTVYHLVVSGWMVTDDTWYSPTLSYSSHQRAPSYGTPDIVAWQSEFTSELAGRGWIRDGGTIHEIALLSFRNILFDEYRASEGDARTRVGEVKRSDRSFGEAVKQLYQRNAPNPNPGYVKSNCFDEGYGVVALERGRDRNGAGTISFDEDGFYLVKDATDVDFNGNEVESETRADPPKKQKLISHLDDAAAQTLLCNATFGVIMDYLEVDRNASPHHFLKSADGLKQEQIVNICERVL